MAYKCRICGINEVDNQGDICELCAVGQDPYAQGQTTSQNTPRPSQSSINNSQSNNFPTFLKEATTEKCF